MGGMGERKMRGAVKKGRSAEMLGMEWWRWS